MIFNNEKLTKETLIKTDKHFAELNNQIIDDINKGKLKVNDKESYLKDLKSRSESYLKGNNRNNLTYLQRAYWIQTNKMIALLP